MRDARENGFTLIELLVVIAVIGVISTLAVVALNNARLQSRDSKRVADIKQIQTALELYFAEQNGYPAVASPGVELGASSQKTLCSNGGWKPACAGTDRTYMGFVPSKALPFDGKCNAAANAYTYTSASGTDYTLTFCLGAAIGDLSAGVHTATPTGIQ